MDNSKGVPTHPWKALTALSFMEKMAVEHVFPAIYRSPPQPHYHKSGAVFGLGRVLLQVPAGLAGPYPMPCLSASPRHPSPSAQSCTAPHCTALYCSVVLCMPPGLSGWPWPHLLPRLPHRGSCRLLPPPAASCAVVLCIALHCRAQHCSALHCTA